MPSLQAAQGNERGPDGYLLDIACRNYLFASLQQIRKELLLKPPFCSFDIEPAFYKVCFFTWPGILTIFCRFILLLLKYICMDFSVKPLSLYFIMVDFEIYSLISYVYKCILESTYTYGMYTML